MSQKSTKPKPPLNDFDQAQQKMLDYDTIHSQVKFLEGKVLTIADASYSDPAQRKAVKDLIKSAFHQQITWIAKIAWPSLSMHTREELISLGVDVEAVERTAIPLE